MLKYRGGALLTALFIMTMIAIVATAMSTRLQLDIYRTHLMIQHDKLYLSTQAVAFWAVSELKNIDKQFTKSNAQGVVATMPEGMAKLTEPIKLNGALYDLQARYNINNLSDSKNAPLFTKLLTETLKNKAGASPKALAQAIVDWISDYQLGKGVDEYTSYYTAQKPPYYPSHYKLQSISELRLIKDVSAEIYNALTPFIAALPESTMINVNTASPEVLVTLGSGLNNNQVNDIIQARGDKGFIKPSDMNEVFTKLNIASNAVAIESTYFMSIADAQVEDNKIRVFTFFKREKNQKTNQYMVSILRQSFNTF